MTDQEIISSLIARDPKVTAQFFFKDCRPLFISIIRRVFGNQIVSVAEDNSRAALFGTEASLQSDR